MSNLKDAMQELAEQTDELKAPIAAIHGAQYAECVVIVSDLVIQYGQAVQLVCSQMPAEVVQLVNVAMAGKINNVNEQFLRMLFPADIKNKAVMDKHYDAFTNHVMMVTEARDRQIDRVVDRFKNYRDSH